MELFLRGLVLRLEILNFGFVLLKHLKLFGDEEQKARSSERKGRVQRSLAIGLGHQALASAHQDH